MRERPGQRCLSSGVTSRWRPTRDSTGWKCLQNTLTHWQRKTPLHSCFPAIVCRASSVCMFILHLFIVFHVIFFLFHFISFFFNYFFFQHGTAVERLDTPGWVIVQLNLYLAAEVGEQLSGTKEELSGAEAPIALQRYPPETKTLLFRNRCWKGRGRGTSTCFVLSPFWGVHSPILYCRYDADTWLVSWQSSHPSSRIRLVSKQDCSYNQILIFWGSLKVSNDLIVLCCGNRKCSINSTLLLVGQLGGKVAQWAASNTPKY